MDVLRLARGLWRENFTESGCGIDREVCLNFLQSPLSEGNAAGPRGFYSIKFGFAFIMTVHFMDHHPRHFCEEFATGLHPVTKGNRETEHHLAVGARPDDQ